MCNDVLARMTICPRLAQTAPTNYFFDRLDRLPFSEQ